MADGPLAHGATPPYVKSSDGQGVLRDLTAGLPVLDQVTVAALQELDAAEEVILDAYNRAQDRKTRRAALDAVSRRTRRAVR